MSAPTASRSRALLAMLRPDALRWAALGGMLAVSSALILAGPLVVRTMVDEATAGTDAAELTRLALVYLAIAVVAQAVTVANQTTTTATAWATTAMAR